MDSFGNTILDKLFCELYVQYFFNLAITGQHILPYYGQCGCGGCVYFNVYYEKYLKDLDITDDKIIFKNIDCIKVEIWSHNMYEIIHPRCVKDRRFLYYTDDTELNFTFLDIKNLLHTLNTDYKNRFVYHKTASIIILKSCIMHTL